MLSIAVAVAALAAPPQALRINGMVAAVMSPFDAAGHLNFSVVPMQDSFLTATGVEWAFVCGTTGESLTLTVAERKALTEHWLGLRQKVIVHVGAESIEDARELAGHAEQHGAKAIAAMPSTFFKPADVDALAAWHAAICNAAPSLPCYYYHIPSMTGANFAMIDFVRAIKPLAPSFVGIKDTGLQVSNAGWDGFMDAQAVMNEDGGNDGGKIEVLSGLEDYTVQCLAIGMTGFVSSMFNYAGDLFGAIIAKYEKEGITKASQPELLALQWRALQLEISFSTAPHTAGMNGLKYYANLAGVPVGDARLPSRPLTADAKASLKAAYDGFCAEQAKVSIKLAMCS